MKKENRQEKAPAVPAGAEASKGARAHFLRTVRENVTARHVQGTDGIGTLGEKRMHVILKRYLSPDPNTHEIPLSGTRYVADVRVGNDIYEVQTGEISPMKEKLSYYLANTDCTVTVVHPITVDKWIATVNRETKTVSEKVKSPKHERAIDLLAALFPIRHLLGNERLRFRLIFLSALEFRIEKAGRRRRALRYERIPLSLLGECEYAAKEDFEALLPDTLPSPFTVKEFSEHTGVFGIDAYSAVRVLEALCIVRACGKRGRAMIFEKTKRE